jgi:predicted dehydrogenase
MSVIKKNKINIGVIGLNNHAARIIDILDNSINAECNYIYYPKNTKHSQNRITKVFSNLINHCEGIIIASPTATHYEYLELLDEYKGYILVEKPIAANLIETNKLKKLALKKRKKITVNYNFIHSPIAKSIKKIIKYKKIGNPILLDIHVSHGLAFSKSYKLNWRANKSSYGVAGLVGVHYINFAINLFGKIIKSNITNLNIAKTGNSSDTTFLELIMPNKIRVHIWLSYATPFKYNISLYGDNGRYDYNGEIEALYSPRDYFDSEGRYTNPPISYENRIYHSNNWKISLENSIENFISAIVNKTSFKDRDYNIALQSMLPLFNKDK